VTPTSPGTAKTLAPAGSDWAQSVVSTASAAASEAGGAGNASDTYVSPVAACERTTRLAPVLEGEARGGAGWAWCVITLRRASPPW
jgi:hypothetical protein